MSRRTQSGGLNQSRRRFVKSTAVATTAAAVGPWVIRSEVLAASGQARDMEGVLRSSLLDLMGGSQRVAPGAGGSSAAGAGGAGGEFQEAHF